MPEPSLHRHEYRILTNRCAALVPAAIALLVGTPLAAQQSCPDGVVSVIFVDNHSVFDTDDFGADRRFRWAYDLANSVHIRTRQDFIRSELLIQPGDCYDPLRVAESGRLLREYSFISRADIFGLRQSDGSWHVVVDTTDEWTTEVNVRFNFDEGAEFRGADVTEENLLGRGIILGAFLRQKDDNRDIGGRLGSPRLLGTRLDGYVSAGSTRVGQFFENQVVYPFVGEIGRFAGRQIYSRREDRFTFWTPERSAVLLPFDRERLDLSVAARFGNPGDLALIGLGVSHQSLDYPGFPGSVGITDDRNFDTPMPADPQTAEAVRAQTLFASTTRVYALFGLRNVRHIRRLGLDAVNGIQDVRLGFDVGLSLGLGVTGETRGAGGAEDAYARIRLFGGTEAGPLIANLDGFVEGRQLLSGSGLPGGWRDVVTQIRGLTYIQPERLGGHTFLLRGAVTGGWRSDLPFQLTLGGPESVRGYREERFPGARRAVFSVEDRVRLPWPRTDLLDLGLTLLADVGRMWAGATPFGMDSGWRTTLGGGLRIGFPGGSRGVFRVDLAFPIDDPNGTGPVLRISMLDLVGLERVLQDQQLSRSLNSVGPDLFNSRLSIF